MPREYKKFIYYCKECPYIYKEGKYIICEKADIIIETRQLSMLVGEQIRFLEPPHWCPLPKSKEIKHDKDI